MAMTADFRSWFEKLRSYRQTDFSTQAAVLLPVVTIAGLTAWMALSGASSANSQSVSPSVAAAAPAIAAPEKTSLADPAPATPASATPPADQATSPTESPPPEASPLDGLKIASQSWRRSGLGSNALVTFTLRNNNDYAVKDIEIACAFNRRDGSHLTDRTRIIRETVNMKSRKTFARMHIGFVNINASRAKCSVVAASRL
jgi:hypothetical protein